MKPKYDLDCIARAAWLGACLIVFVTWLIVG
jgi:hypothetical protein